MVQEIENVTGVKTEFKKPRLLSGGDPKDISSTLTINKESSTPIKRQNQVPDDIMNLLTPTPNHGLSHHHILSVDMFSKDQLNEIFNLAQTLKVYVTKGRPLDNILKVSIKYIEFIEYIY